MGGFIGTGNKDLGLAAMGLDVAGGLISAGGSYASGRAQRDYYRAQATAAESEARLGEMAAEREIGYDMQTAALQSAAISREGRKIFGAQKAAMAANEMDLSSGSAMDVVSDSARAEAYDKSLLAFQAQRSAYEKRLQAQLNSLDLYNQAQQSRLAGANAYGAGKMGALGTLLTTAGSVAGKWYDLSQTKTPKSKKSAIGNQTLSQRERQTLKELEESPLYRKW